MFDSLTARIAETLSRLRGKGSLREADVDAGLREIRIALLEADVHYKVAKAIIERIHERAVGEHVLDSLTPGQQLVKIVRDELTVAMGSERATLSLGRRPAVICLLGLQGSGKTTTAAKLAARLMKDGKKPLLAAADVHRPAAIDQLKTLGEALGIPVVADASLSAEAIARQALDRAVGDLHDVVIVDTAGRLQIDGAMMDELDAVVRAASPDERLLVADAMTGQEAVHIAAAFDERIGLTGVILTKMDGDARGGAALSIRHVTGRPIVYVGTGERVDEFEPFHPQRMAERILGMGDVLSLIEQAEEQIDGDRAEKLVRRIQRDQLTLQDFLEQLEEMQKLGPLSQILDRLPSAVKRKTEDLPVDERETKQTLAILRAMTVEERLNPSIIGGSRKKRIAQGSGTRVRDVNRVLARFNDTKRALKELGGRRGRGRLPGDLLNFSP